MPPWFITGVGGGLFALFTITGGWAFASVRGDVEILKVDVPIVRENVATVMEGMDHFHERLDRIEDKVDRVLLHVQD